MSEGKRGTRLACLIGIGVCVAIALCAGAAVLVTVRQSKEPGSGRLVRVAVTPSLDHWLSAVSSARHPSWPRSDEDAALAPWSAGMCWTESHPSRRGTHQDAATLVPGGHRCVVLDASIPVRAMEPTSRRTEYRLCARDLSLVTSSEAEHHGVTLVMHMSPGPVMLDSLETTTRPPLLCPWQTRPRFRARVLFALPDSDIPGTFTVNYRGVEIGTFELRAHHGATGFDVVRPD